MGEGAGVLVLEDAEQAEARGATILGELLGYGASSDAYHLTAPDPEGDGAARAIKVGAARRATSTPADLDYVNAHGTSTPLNDRSETVALIKALGAEDAHRIPVSSTKSAIGHLLGAAGAVEAIATLLALRERTAPPTLGYERARGRPRPRLRARAREADAARRTAARSACRTRSGSADTTQFWCWRHDSDPRDNGIHAPGPSA